MRSLEFYDLLASVVEQTYAMQGSKMFETSSLLGKILYHGFEILGPDTIHLFW